MRIIVIDSNIESQQFFNGLGKKMNFSVSVFSKPAPALALLKNPKELTLIFIGNGENPLEQSIAACQFVGPNIPIFVITEDSDAPMVKKAFIQGIRGVVRKPLLRDAIADILQEVEVIEYFRSHLRSLASQK